MSERDSVTKERPLADGNIAFLQVVAMVSTLPVFCWRVQESDESPTKHEGCWWHSKASVDHPCGWDETLCKKLACACQQERPGVFFETEFVFYGIMRLGQVCIAVGPAVRNAVSDEYAAQYAQSHQLPHAIVLKKVGVGQVTEYLMLIYTHFTGRCLRHEEISVHGMGSNIFAWASEGALAHYQLNQSEYERSHQSGTDFESELVAIVKSGDIEGVKKLMGGTLPDMEVMGAVADEERKQMEYLSVSLITLLTRAAVEGGLRSEVAHELGDVFMKRLASASSRGESYTALGFRAMYEFTQQVYQARETRRNQSHIEACKDYIEKNLRKNLKVGEIAPAIGISRSYLAHQFSKVEGITVQQYIQREKCRHAANLLKYSDYSISLISGYFGFSTQSYFSTCFAQWYGMTPGKYRWMNYRK